MYRFAPLVVLLLTNCWGSLPTIAEANELNAHELQANALTIRELQAGAAAVDISPQQLPARCNGGFLERSVDRIDDPLYARALILSDGVETIALVVIDSCMMTTEVCDSIKQLAVKQTGIRHDRILISATHTHSAPSVMDLCLGSSADPVYTTFLPAQVARAISLAHENLQPAKLGWAIVDGSDLTNCRRWITRSDRMGTDPFGEQTIRAMMHPGYQNPSYTSPAGPIDPWLSVISVVSAENETPLCVMANLSMHYFGAGGGFSADYFGDVNRMLETSFNKQQVEAGISTEAKLASPPDFVSIMSQGTSGDLHWMDYSQPQRGTTRQQYAEAVVNRVQLAVKEIEYRNHLPLAMAEKRLVIERRIPTRARREWARPINAARGELAPRNQMEVYAQQAEWIHENPTAEVVLQAVRIGDLALTAMPTETYGITGLKLKRRSPLVATVNLELSNGAVGYIPPPEQHRLGGYTTWPARTAGLSEQAEPQIVDSLLNLLEEVTQSPRRPLTHPETAYSQAIINKQPVAYWRLDDMTALQAEDAMGKHHAQYMDGVALFLPGSSPATHDGDQPTTLLDANHDYGNRCVYLAGGHIVIELDKPDTAASEFSLTMLLRNCLPPDARELTGIVVATEHLTLAIAGSTHPEHAGRLLLQVGPQQWVGKTSISTGPWQQLAVTQADKRLRIYLDGQEQPEIVADLTDSLSFQQLFIGSDGKANQTFDGQVDEIACFPFELSTADVIELYQQSGLTPAPTPKPTIKLGPKPTDAEARSKYARAVMQSQPLAYWRLHDLSTQSASDSVGQLAGKYEPGAESLHVDSVRSNFTGGRVKAQTAKLGMTYSIEFWFRNELPLDARPVTAYLFSRAVDGQHGADGDNLGLGGTHSHAGRLLVFNGNGKDQLVAGSTRIEVGSWSYVVMVRDEQRVSVYLNGDPQPEIEAELPIAFSADCQDILIGGRADDFANLQGMLEEVALYDRPLTPSEIQAHYLAAGVQPIAKRTQVHVADQSEAESHEPMPTEPEQALRNIHVREGYQVELVAAEPLVLDPVAIDWGPDGKLWVVEMADYPLGMDGQGMPGGRVRYLEDTNEDGKYDTSTLFADQLPFPNGILVWGSGVLVTAAPEIVYLADSTGDGQADIRRVLYSGFMEGNQQLRVNGLRWGLDNWIYCASGSHHGGYGKDSQILSLFTGRKHQVGSRDFRIRPSTGQLDPQSGPSQYGRNRDDWGNWFGVQNSYPLWHYVLADHHIRRNPHYAPPDPKQQVVTPSNPPVYPASQLEKRYHSFEQSGRFTSACSAMIYRDNYLFPHGAEQHAFTCEPFHNLVQHNVITDAGVSFTFHRDPAEAEIDFFASKDRWCRPVMVRTGPDGALWVVDMYRYMIEHPEWLPPEGRKELEPWYRAGDDRGRIYRVVRSDQTPRSIPDLAERSAAELVAALESPNGWQRDLAQRMIVGSDPSAEQLQVTAQELIKLVQRSQNPLARLHAMWTLHGLGALQSDMLHSLLADPHPGVRRNAVQLAAEHKVAIDLLARLTKDPDSKVRLELANTLGEYEGPQAAGLLAELLVQSTAEPYILAASISSLNADNVIHVLQSLMRHETTARADVIAEVIEQAIALSPPTALVTIVDLLTHQEQSFSGLGSFTALGPILDTLRNKPEHFHGVSAAARERMEQSLAKILDRARAAAVNTSLEIETRVAAVGLLGHRGNDRSDDLQLFADLLTPQSPIELQSAVVRSLAGRDDRQVAELFLEGWPSHSPLLRSQLLETLISRPAWSEMLRARLENGSIRREEFTAAQQQQLMQGEQRAAWQKVFTAQVSGDRRAIVREFESALSISGKSEHGEPVFRKLCINCHQLGQEGYEVGPQLTAVTDQSPSALLNSILDPNASIDAKYFNYAILTVDGRTLSGRLETETGSSITLLTAAGKRETILRRDVEAFRSMGTSVMPEGLEQGLTPQDLADLIAFVRERFR